MKFKVGDKVRATWGDMIWEGVVVSPADSYETYVINNCPHGWALRTEPIDEKFLSSAAEFWWVSESSLELLEEDINKSSHELFNYRWTYKDTNDGYNIYYLKGDKIFDAMIEVANEKIAIELINRHNEGLNDGR